MLVETVAVRRTMSGSQKRVHNVSKFTFFTLLIITRGGLDEGFNLYA